MLDREKAEKNTEKETREQAFRRVIFTRLTGEYAGELENVGFSDEQIAEFQRALLVLPEEQRMAALALPAEIRQRKFVAVKKQIDAGLGDMAAAAGQLAQEAENRGFRLGYHLSDKDILPRQNQNGGAEWDIKGLDADDRDELSRAYYSLDYENFYRGKPAEYIYIVRAETGADSAHKIDPANQWGRASDLSVISRFSREETEDAVRELLSPKKAAV